MRETANVAELSVDQLELVAGGMFDSGVGSSGHTGSISFNTGGLGGASVSWPGKVGGVDGTWTISGGGVSWHAT